MKKYLLFLKPYKFELYVLIGIYLLYKVNKFFSMFSGAADGATTVVDGATAGLVQSAKETAQRVAIRTIAPNATAADLAVFEADARALASCFGYLPGVYNNMLFANRSGALQVAKKYSHYLFNGAKKVVHRDKANQLVGTTRKDSLRLPVLYPFYHEATNGRSLAADLEEAMTQFNDDIKSFYVNIVK